LVGNELAHRHQRGDILLLDHPPNIDVALK
jgi:hypothetical protein